MCACVRVCVCVWCVERGGASVYVYCGRACVYVCVCVLLGCNTLYYGFHFQRIKTSSASEDLSRQSLPCGTREKEKKKKKKTSRENTPTHARKGHPQKTHSDVLSALLTGSVICGVIR